MKKKPRKNPLLAPILDSFELKRDKTGIVPANWLLIVLRILDQIRDRDVPLVDDDIYTYDYTLKRSRAKAIPDLLTKYGLPSNIGLSKEGVTVRGAPGLRIFREIEGGAVIMDFPKELREALLQEAIGLVREEIMKLLKRDPIALPAHVFREPSAFVDALLTATEDRSNGRVEQALVGAKLQIRFPEADVPANPCYAGDRQTGRECDYEVERIRVIVSVAPKDQHYESAKRLAAEDRMVYLVVAEKAFNSARKKVKGIGCLGPVTVMSVADYVTSNMKEIATERKFAANQICMRLAAEYNRRVEFERDRSLEVKLPQ